MGSRSNPHYKTPENKDKTKIPEEGISNQLSLLFIHSQTYQSKNRSFRRKIIIAGALSLAYTPPI
jgi:hypothetical protein